MTKVLVFDVNETLLDLRALDPHFQRIFGDSRVRKVWFGLVLRNALTLTILGEYHDFVSVGSASLQMVADQHGLSLGPDDRTAISATMAALPPHGDVAPNLTRLAEAGFRLAALTNSPQEAAETQLTNAGIAGQFERIMSVAATGTFKPAAAVYAMAAAELDADPEALTLVAAHDWDIAGAMKAGWRGAYLTRPGMAINPLFPRPHLTGSDLTVLTDQLLANR